MFEKWVDYDFVIVVGLLYVDDDEVLVVVVDIGIDVDFIVMDCMGYMFEMKVIVCELMGMGVLFGWLVLVKIVEEVF